MKINKISIIRAGYKIKKIFITSSEISGGIGIKINNLNVDYSISNLENLGMIHRISLLINSKNSTKNQIRTQSSKLTTQKSLKKFIKIL
ncbi:MAG: hypothetical protein N2Z20_02745 [Elusimicrobiales bacterium]|nr:hypothetical protein [Elusimicrobiales bacterium]